MIKVYGASDDCIQIEGDLREEFYAIDDKLNLLAFSNGVVLEIGYGNAGMWKISVLKDPDNCVKEYHPASDIDEDYSDIVAMEITGPHLPHAPWVVYGHEWKRI